MAAGDCGEISRLGRVSDWPGGEEMLRLLRRNQRVGIMPAS